MFSYSDHVSGSSKFFINNLVNGTELVPKFDTLTVPNKKSPQWYRLKVWYKRSYGNFWSSSFLFIGSYSHHFWSSCFLFFRYSWLDLQTQLGSFSFVQVIFQNLVRRHSESPIGVHDWILDKSGIQIVVRVWVVYVQSSSPFPAK